MEKQRKIVGFWADLFSGNLSGTVPAEDFFVPEPVGTPSEFLADLVAAAARIRNILNQIGVCISPIDGSVTCQLIVSATNPGFQIQVFNGETVLTEGIRAIPVDGAGNPRYTGDEFSDNPEFSGPPTGGGGNAVGATCRLAGQIYNNPRSPKSDGDTSAIDCGLETGGTLTALLTSQRPECDTTLFGFEVIRSAINATAAQTRPGDIFPDKIDGTVSFVGALNSIDVNLQITANGQLRGRIVNRVPCNRFVTVGCQQNGEVEEVRFQILGGNPPGGDCACAESFNEIKQSIDRLERQLFDTNRILIRALPRYKFWGLALTVLTRTIGGGFTFVGQCIILLVRVLTFKSGDTIELPEGESYDLFNDSDQIAIDLTEPVTNLSDPYGAPEQVVAYPAVSPSRGEIQQIGNPPIRYDRIRLEQIPQNTRFVALPNGEQGYRAGFVSYVGIDREGRKTVGQRQFIYRDGQVVSSDVPLPQNVQLSPNPGFIFSALQLI